MTVKKVIGKTHRWLGLTSGLVVFILGITGCLYAFIDEIRPLVYKHSMFVTVPPNAQRLPLDVIRARAQEAIGQQYPLQVAEIPLEANRTISFRSLKINRDKLLYAGYMDYYYRVYVNPYTGAVVKLENVKWEFFNLVVTIHINLLLGPVIGGQIVTWSVVIFVVLLISGMVLWWPKNKAAAKQRFRFNWKETTKWKRKNYDLHNVLGFYAMIILLGIAFTGLVWCFGWLDNTLQWVANGGKTYAKPAALFSDSTNTRAFSLDNILHQAVLHNPEAATFFIGIPKDTKSPVFVYARHDKQRFRSVSNQYDQHTAALLFRKTFSAMNNGEKISAMNYDLHVGSIMGLPGKILAFLASLIAASLPVTGLYIWWGRKNKQPKKSQLDIRIAA
jgi:uncharacterized iron-regulated membrane protein